MFQELMKAIGKGEVLEMAQLADKLPLEARGLIAGMEAAQQAIPGQ